MKEFIYSSNREQELKEIEDMKADFSVKGGVIQEENQMFRSVSLGGRMPIRKQGIPEQSILERVDKVLEKCALELGVDYVAR